MKINKQRKGFSKGYKALNYADRIVVKDAISKALKLTDRMQFYNRMRGSICCYNKEINKVTEVFSRYINKNDIWDSPLIVIQEG